MQSSPFLPSYISYNKSWERLLTYQENSSRDHAINSPFLLPYVSYSSSGEKLLTYQENSSLVAMLLMLLSCSCIFFKQIDSLMKYWEKFDADH